MEQGQLYHQAEGYVNERTHTRGYERRCTEPGRGFGEVDADRPSSVEDRKRCYEVVADAPFSAEGRKWCYEVEGDTTRWKAMQ